MKKVFAMLMILALIVGVFGGCASKAQTASSEEQTQVFPMQYSLRWRSLNSLRSIS